jgi:hypothetical protein
METQINNSMFKILGGCAVILVILLTLVFQAEQNKAELKGKLLTSGVTANSIRCAINNDQTACASAAAEDRTYATHMQDGTKVESDISTIAP